MDRVTRERLGKTGKVILGVVAVAGILAVGAVAPNAIQMLTQFGLGKNKNRGYHAQTTLNKMIDRGLIEMKKNENGKYYLKLTPAGKRYVHQFRLGIIKLKKPKQWDGKWRVIIFDIKEIRRGQRDRLREELYAIGFKWLQNSVWVFPYPCEEIALMIKTDLGVAGEVLYMTVESIENDKALRIHFKL